MADKKLAQLYIDIDGRTKNLENDLKRLKRDVGKDTEKISKKFSSTWTKHLGIVAAGVGVLVAGFATIKSSIGAFINERRAILQINQAVKQTGYAAGLSSKELRKVAADLQDINGIGDEEFLRSVTANLLTFTNISGEAFKRAQQAVADVNAVINQGSIAGLSSQAIQLGKALNDPIANLGALGRSGIQFSATQKEMIKNFAATGELGKAQAIILGEIEKQYGGQAKALNDAALGTTNLKNAWGDLKEAIGAAFAPMLEQIIPAITKAIKGWIALLTPVEERLKNLAPDYKEQQELLKNLEGTSEEFRKNEKKRIDDAIKKQNELIESNRELLKTTNNLYGSGSFIDLNKINADVSAAKLLIQQYQAQLEALDKYSAGERAGAGALIPEPDVIVPLLQEVEKSKEPQLILPKEKKDYKNIFEQDPRGEISGDGVDIIGEQLQEGLTAGIDLGNEFTNTFTAGLQNVGDSIKANISNQLAQAIVYGQGLDNIFKGIASQLLSFGISSALNAILPGSGFLAGAMGAHDGGSFYGTDKGVMKMASGGSFIVPSGYSNDSFPLMVESGERVTVTPSGQTGTQDKLLKEIGNQIKILNANTVETRKQTVELRGRLESTIEGSDIKMSYDRQDKYQTRYAG